MIYQTADNGAQAIFVKSAKYFHFSKQRFSNIKKYPTLSRLSVCSSKAEVEDK
jgi:hypothetical protein